MLNLYFQLILWKVLDFNRIWYLFTPSDLNLNLLWKKTIIHCDHFFWWTWPTLRAVCFGSECCGPIFKQSPNVSEGHILIDGFWFFVCFVFRKKWRWRPLCSKNGCVTGISEFLPDRLMKFTWGAQLVRDIPIFVGVFVPNYYYYHRHQPYLTCSMTLDIWVFPAKTTANWCLAIFFIVWA